MPQLHSYPHHQELNLIDDEETIYDCMKCFESCTSCIQHCLREGGNHADAIHIQLLMSCAELCQLSATFMLQKSEFTSELCSLCAKVCLATAESCQEIDADDFMMQECSSACRKCAESCQNMAT